MNSQVNSKKPDTAHIARLIWLVENRGILTRVAADCSVTPSMVSAVYNGRVKSRKVYNRLAELGAPGFVAEASNASSES